MKPNAVKLLSAGILLTLSAVTAQAQTIYRIVGADGRVTFSDKPPATPDKATVTGAGGRSAPADAGAGELPFELHQVVNRYPVTLYTSTNCPPCGAGRALLSSRGVPFTERTVNTAEDNAALQRLSGDNSLPFLTIGGQQIKGYSDSEWIQFLDAAGYPKTSQLPASYRSPAPAPLVAVQKPDATPAPAAMSQTRRANDVPTVAPVQPPAVTPSNPAGITF